MDIAGQAAIVTGGGSGLGAATARMLAQAGAKVAVLDLNANAAADVTSALRRHLVDSVSWCVWVERGPAAFPICRRSKGWIHQLVALQDFPGCRGASIIDAGYNESAAASNAFGIKVGVGCWHTCARERAY